MQITAAVVREKFGQWEIDTLDLTEPRADEILVRVVASGMCQTDQHGKDGYTAMPFPAVFGHEGAGMVEAVGTNVTRLAPGDHVVMSFPWCGSCPNCRRERLSYCYQARDLKGRGSRPDGSTLMRDARGPVHSAFFQQSSFGSYAVVAERFAAKVRKDAPLDRLGAFGCSIQTGAGTVLNSLKPRDGDGLIVYGAGAVGLSALLAAKVAGCDPVIAVDIHDHRLALARELGATHTVKPTAPGSTVPEVRAIMERGVEFAVETSAKPAVLREAVEVLAPGGTCALVGSARAGTEAGFEMPFLQNGRSIRGVVQGDSRPTEFIPKLVDLFAEGRLPVDRMMTFYPLADINQAASDSNSGKTIKPVLRMPH